MPTLWRLIIKLLLAGIGATLDTKSNIDYSIFNKTNILESFYYIKPWQIEIIPMLNDFMLDSGAFTFINTGRKIDFELYNKKYALFVKKHNIKNFIELDVDGIVGFEKYNNMLQQLEDIAGRQAIPVFHKRRGKDWFLEIIQKYKYVAIGGIAIKDITKDEYKYFRWFTNEAKKQGTRMHALGFTQLKTIDKYGFYSVDSSTWTFSLRGGTIAYFNGKELVVKRTDKRYKDRIEFCLHNLKEWIKYSKYLDKDYIDLGGSDEGIQAI